MDGRERLHAVLDGEQLGFVPSAFWHHYDQAHMFGEQSVEAHLRFYQEVRCDLFKVMNEHMFHIGETISKPEDWKKIRKESFQESPYPAFIEECKAIKKRLPSDVPLFATVHGVLVSAYHATEKPGNFSNPNNMISRHLRENPEAVAKGLAVVADSLCVLCEQILDAGLDGVYYAALGGEAYRFDQQLFERYVKPFDAQVIGTIKAKGGVSILHICKDNVRLPMYQGIDADIINWDVHDCPYPIESGRALFPDKTLLGGFDDRSGILVEGTKEEIERETERIISAAGRKRFILGADCTLPEGIEPWRIQTAMAKARSL